MKKGITPIIAIVLLLIMTVAAFGLTFIWVQNTQTGMQENVGENIKDIQAKASSCMSIDTINFNKVYLRNCGEGIISNKTLTIYVNGAPVNYALNGDINEGETKEVELAFPSIENTNSISFQSASGKISKTVYKTAIKKDIISDPSLVGYWAFDEGGGTSTKDSSGNGNIGMSINDPQWISGKSNTGLQFDGVDDYVDCGNGNSLNIQEHISIELWFNSSAYSGWNGGSFYNHGGADWTPANGEIINGTHYNINTFTIPAGTTVHVKECDGAQYGGTAIYANNANILGTLDASGKGYLGGAGASDGEGPGYGGGGSEDGGGGGYGGVGGNGYDTGLGGIVYGTSTSPDKLGSGGGGGRFGYVGGSGGGLVTLTISGILTNDGSIIANGGNGAGSGNRGGGGGSGGAIYLSVGTLAGTGTMTANGGIGGSSCCGGGGGGGGGGRIAYYYTTKTFSGTITANGGAGCWNTHPAHGCSDSGPGTIYESSTIPSNVPALVAKGNAYILTNSGTLLTGAINGNSIATNIFAGWNHIALTYDKDAGGTDEMKLYINGVEVAVGDYSAAISTNTNNLIIGNASNGALDEVRIWNRALSEEEIKTIYEMDA